MSRLTERPVGAEVQVYRTQREAPLIINTYCNTSDGLWEAFSCLSKKAQWPGIWRLKLKLIPPWPLLLWIMGHIHFFFPFLWVIQLINVMMQIHATKMWQILSAVTIKSQVRNTHALLRSLIRPQTRLTKSAIIYYHNRFLHIQNIMKISWT